MSDAFISYSRTDSKPLVKRLHRALQDAGKETWVDLEDIPTGSRWQEDLREGIAASDAFVFVISPKAIASEQCRQELEHAAKLNKRILPINHQPVDGAELPEPLSSHNWLPADGRFEDHFEESLEALIEAIDTDLPWVRAHTHWGKRATEWEENGRDKSFLLRGSELGASEEWLARQSGKEPAPTQLQNDYILASRKASARRQRVTLIAVAAALLVSAILSVFALLQRSQAISKQNEAFSRELAASSADTLASDPELSVLLAIKAVQTSQTQQAVAALRQALYESRLRATFRSAGGAVRSAAFSPDGRTVATASKDGVARLWDVASGKQTKLLFGHGAGLNSVGFSPDGRLLLTGSSDGTAALWNLASGKQATVLHAPSGIFYDARFGPDGHSVVTAGSDGRARIWSAATGKEISALQAGGPLVAAALSPNGRSVVTLRVRSHPRLSGGAGVNVWNVASGKQTMSARVPGASDAAIAAGDTGPGDASFSPDGRFVIAAGAGGTARVWNAATGRQAADLRGRGSAVERALNSASFSPDGRSVITASRDHTARVWDLASRTSTVLRGHTGAVSDAEFSPDGGSIVTASGDGTARVWDVAGTAPTALRRSGVVDSASFSKDRGSLATIDSSGTAQVWDVSTGTQSGRFRVHSASYPSTNVVLSPNGRLVLLSGNRGTVRLFDVASGTRTEVLRARRGKRSVSLVPSADFSHDGRFVVEARPWGAAIFDLATRKQTFLQTPTRGIGAEVMSAEFSPDDNSIVTCEAGGAVRLWDVASGKQTQVLNARADRAVFGIFTPDGGSVVVAYEDGTARVWDAASGKQTAVLRGHKGPVLGVDVSPDGRSVVTGGTDGTARVWDLASGQPLAVLHVGTGQVVAAVFGRAGRSVLTAGPGSVIHRYPCDACAGPVDHLLALAGRRVTRSLTPNERATYLHEQISSPTRPEPGFLGVFTQPVYPELAHHLGLKTDFGALVLRVQNGTSADKAHLHGGEHKVRLGPGSLADRLGALRVGGDVILAVNGQRVVSPDDLPRYISSLQPGDTADLEILRDNETKHVEVTIGARSDVIHR